MPEYERRQAERRQEGEPNFPIRFALGIVVLIVMSLILFYQQASAI